MLLAILGSQAFKTIPEAMPAAQPLTRVSAVFPHSTLNADLFQNFITMSSQRMYPRLSREIVESAVKYSEKYGLSPILVLAIVKTESEFYPFALSNKNAKGLMQIHPESNQKLLIQEGIFKEPADIFDPDRNIEAGCFLLRRFINESPDLNTALDKYLGADSISYKAQIHEALGRSSFLESRRILTKLLSTRSNPWQRCKLNDESRGTGTPVLSFWALPGFSLSIFLQVISNIIDRFIRPSDASVRSRRRPGIRRELITAKARFDTTPLTSYPTNLHRF